MLNSFFIIVNEGKQQKLSLDNLENKLSYRKEFSGITFLSATPPLLCEDNLVLLDGHLCESETLKTNRLTELISKPDAHLSDLNGSFSAVLVSESEAKISIVCDPLGSLPVYYSTQGTRFITNDLSCLALLPELSLQLNEQKMIEYLSGNFFDAESTLYKHVSCMQAANKLVITASGTKLASYAEPEKLLPSLPKQNSPDFLRALKLVVSQSLDHGTGFELSGGLDSSAVVCVAALITDRTLPCFSIQFSESRMDESSYRDSLRKRYALNLYEISARTHSQSEYMQIARDLNYFPDFPNSVQSVYINECALNSGINNILTGFGGDQIFAPPALLKTPDPLSIIPQRLRRFFSPHRYLPWLSREAEDFCLAKISKNNQRYSQLKLPDKPQSILTQLLHPNTRSFLHSASNLSRSFGIERRHPFLDLRLAAIASCVSEEELQKTKLTKPLLRLALKDICPTEILQRTDKAEFSSLYLKSIKQEEMLPLFESALERWHKLLNPDIFRQAYQNPNLQEMPMLYTIWNLLGLEIFCRVKGL